MNLRQNIITNNLITLSSFIILIIISFITAKDDVKKTVLINLESVTNTIYESSLLFSKNDDNFFEKEEFKNFIKNVKIGEKGYIYFVDLKGNILIHPNLENKNISNESFFKEIYSNKKEGNLSYAYEGKNKIISYKLLANSDMIIISSIDESDFLEDIFQHFIQNIVILGIAFIFIIGILSFKFLKSIDKNIKDFNNYFAEFLNFITFKQNRITKVNTNNNNEFSSMINQINSVVDEFDKKLKDDMKVIGEIVLTMDKVQQGIFRCRIKSDTNNPMIRTLRNTINQALTSLEDSMKELQKVVTSYTNNDFTDKIEIPSKMKARLLAVMEGVNILGKTLAEVSKQNLENGQILENNSSIMKSSMLNLAAKANEQATTLEETAASVEEITSITRSNTQNAQKMTTLGETVKSAVHLGQELASKTAISMEEINDKVNAINEAIIVIDQIAFQTNILSLNAAVEAATAGEVGKGFAVVAQEVRNLASRSAEAAREIKHLVEEAHSKANEGKEISSKMINGYEILNNHISETISIIHDVSTAAKEQMSGIEQINDTILMLDKVTQENANEATQITSIASDVSTMAQNLVLDAKTKKFN